MNRNGLPAFLLALFVATPGWAWEPGDEVKCPARGSYVNPYGFSVEIPRGLNGCPNSPVEMSDHGVIIPLDATGQGTVEVYAGYNALLHETVRDAIDTAIETTRNDAKPGSVAILSRSRTRLGGLKAERVVLRYKIKGSEAEVIRDSTEALRAVIKPDSEPSHHYSLTLSTTPNRYEADRAILDRVRKSWRRTATEDSRAP